MQSNVISLDAVRENGPSFCTACDLHQTLGGKQILYGVGPETARVMLVGEAPGTQESREGIPFIGDAGVLLNKLMAKAGLKRQDVFVTNSVRCQPPIINKKQQKPKKHQIAACRQHLAREVDTIRPALIIALGNPALESLCGLTGITKYRGQIQTVRAKGEFKDLAGIPVMPTFHPAYALREPIHEKDITFDILTGLRSIYGGFNEVATPWQMFSSCGVPDMNSPLWSWDIETNAREMNDPELCTWMLSVDDGERITMFDSFYLQDAVDIIRTYLARGGQLVGQNASAYDREVMRRLFGENFKTHDTQLLCHLLDEEAATNLQAQAIRELGVAPWKDGFDADFWRTWDTKSSEEKLASYEYNARDTRYTRMIFIAYWNRANWDTRRLYERHNLPVSRALCTTEHNGVWISLENVDSSMAELEVEQRVNLLHIQDLTRPDINPGSHQQVREVLFGDLMLPIQNVTSGGEASTDVESLKKLVSMELGGPVLDSILKYRKSSKLLQFLKAYREIRPAHGFIYPSYSMTTTVNYRTSSFDPNIQQVPRDPRVRKMVAAPPGYVLIEADYKMLELYVAAELTGPQCALYQALFAGQDVHKIMASRLTGKPLELVTKEERSNAKPSNFAYLYYADEPTYIRQALVEYDRVVSMEEAAFAKQAFRAWGVEPWWLRVEDELKTEGEVRSLFGAYRRLPAIRSRDAYNRLEALREAINFTDASVACHISELALTCAVGRGFQTAGFIHDAVLCYAREEDAQSVAQTLQYDMEVTVMQLIEELFEYRWTLPLKAEISIGRYWGDKA